MAVPIENCDGVIVPASSSVVDSSSDRIRRAGAYAINAIKSADHFDTPAGRHRVAGLLVPITDIHALGVFSSRCTIETTAKKHALLQGGLPLSRRRAADDAPSRHLQRGTEVKCSNGPRSCRGSCSLFYLKRILHQRALDWPLRGTHHVDQGAEGRRWLPAALIIEVKTLVGGRPLVQHPD